MWALVLSAAIQDMFRSASLESWVRLLILSHMHDGDPHVDPGPCQSSPTTSYHEEREAGRLGVLPFF